MAKWPQGQGLGLGLEFVLQALVEYLAIRFHCSTQLDHVGRHTRQIHAFEERVVAGDAADLHRHHVEHIGAQQSQGVFGLYIDDVHRVALDVQRHTGGLGQASEERALDTFPMAHIGREVAGDPHREVCSQSRRGRDSHADGERQCTEGLEDGVRYRSSCWVESRVRTSAIYSAINALSRRRAISATCASASCVSSGVLLFRLRSNSCRMLLFVWWPTQTMNGKPCFSW